MIHVRDTLLERPERPVRDLGRPSPTMEAHTPIYEALAKMRLTSQQLVAVMRDGEGLCDAGVPVMEVTPQQIKQFATGRGNASKAEMVAAYAKAWPDAVLGRNVEDRADAAHAAALGAAWIGVQGLPQSMTAVRTKLLSKLPEPTLPARWVGTAGAA